ncbi:MAG: GTPase Era, partial [Bdellovibrionales bacterium]|nr:GTPase Era [Bdellovibrionales bacterium]
KPQTTRQRVTGVLTNEDFQAIFVDAPGVVRPQAGLNHFLSGEFQSVVEDVDVLFLLLQLDAKSPDVFHELIALAQKSKKPVLGIVTKIDRPEKHRILVLKEMLEKAGIESIKASALKNAPLMKEDVFEWLKKNLPETGAPLVDEEIYTTQNMKQMAAELIREKCFEYLHQEVPFGLAVHILKFDESQPNLTKIHAEIWVSRDSHQGIVIGRGGSSLKRIGSEARRDIEKLIDTKVFLDLHVKVKKNWSKDEQIMKELGYVTPQSL